MKYAFMEGNSLKKTSILLILIGLGAISVSLFVTPTFATNYISPDKNISTGGLAQLQIYRVLLASLGVFLSAIGITIVIIHPKKVKDIYNWLIRMFPVWSKTVLSMSWGILISWFWNEDITLLLGINTRGYGYIFHIFLIGVYSLVLTVICFLLISVIERFFYYWRNEENFISRHYQILILISISLVLLIHPVKYIFNFLTFPYPIELREPVLIHSAYAFDSGINPYSLQSYPEYIYLYGILYPLTLAPFIKLAVHPLLVARAYSVLFFVLFSGLSISILIKRGASKISSLVGALILLNSMCLIWAVNGARPDAPALFFSFLGFYIMEKDNYGYRSIIFSAIACVLSLHFKQYLLFSAVVIAVYLFLFISKQKGLTFASEYFPLYYEYSILHHLIAGEGVNTRGVSHLIMQSKHFFKYYWILLFLFLYHVFKVISNISLDQLKKIRFKPLILTEPFITFFPVDIYSIGIFLSAAILTLWLGKNYGNVYTYYGELLLPFLLFLIIPKIDEWFKNGLSRNLCLLSILLLCVLPFSVNYGGDFSGWRESYRTLERYYKDCSNVYDQTSFAALYKIEHNMHPVYNNGQVAYALSVIPNTETFPGKISEVPVELLEQRLFEWNSNIEHNLENQTFDCIFSIKEIYDQYDQAAVIKNVTGSKIIFQVPYQPE